MKTVEFSYRYMPFLQQWLKRRNMEVPKFEDLPHLGYMAVLGDPVCIGFLHRAEGNFCFLGSLTTNPDYKSAQRDEAIDIVVKVLIETAQILGFKTMIAWTVEESIVKRSDKFGFKILNQTLIGKDL